MGFNMRKKNIALIGYMGTGKTTIGKRLARKLGLTFVDTDAYIEKQQGKKISQIFEEDGEPAFRRMEETALKALMENENLLISTGGGIVLSEQNRKVLKERTFLVTLTASPGAIYSRVRGNTDRPLLQEADPYQKIVDMLRARKPYYEIGDMMIPTDELSEKICIERIVEAYQKS